MNDTIKTNIDLAVSTVESSPAFFIWLSFLIALMGLAGYALLVSIIHSIEVLEISVHLIWTMMISNYVFLVTSSIGLCLVSSLGLVFGIKRFNLIAQRGYFLALITIVLGLLGVLLHLGHPERSQNNFLSPNITSAMWWMSILYPPYIGSLAVTFWLLARADLAKISRVSNGLKARSYELLTLRQLDRFIDLAGGELKAARLFGILSIILGLTAYSVEGTLFAHTEVRAFWYGSEYSLYFLFGALLSGFAWLPALSIITYKARSEKIPAELKDLFLFMAQIMVLLISIGLLLTVGKLGYGLFQEAEIDTVMLLLSGPFRINFWVIEIGIGYIAPFLLLVYAVYRGNLAGVAVGSLMIMFGLFVYRYDFVVVAQVFPVLKEGLPSYRPTIMETMLVSGLLAACMFLYTLGDKFLPLKNSDVS